MSHRRGVALIAVVVAVILGAYAAATALDLGRASANASHTSSERVIAHTHAWAGVRAYAEELLEQRDELLEGASLELPDELTIVEGETKRVLARLIAVSGETAIPESVKIDVNRATPEMLSALPGIDEALASAIVATRERAPMHSVTDLLSVKGVSIELLFGPLESLRRPWLSANDGPRSALDAPEFFASGVGDTDDLPLADVLTVFSAEPNVQSGLGQDGERFLGMRRINLQEPWSERLRELIVERYDEETASAIETIKQNTTFETKGDIVRVLIRFGVDSSNWAEILDAFTTTADPYLLGRVDVMRAPAAVLAVVPGLDEETAQRIVDAREAQRQSGGSANTAWLVEEEVISADAYADAVDWLAARSLQYRLVIATWEEDARSSAGFDDLAVPDELAAFDENDEHDARERLRVTEVVIDLAAPRPRIALLRDVTARPFAAGLAGIVERDAEREPSVAALSPTEASESREDGFFPDQGGGAGFDLLSEPDFGPSSLDLSDSNGVRTRGLSGNGTDRGGVDDNSGTPEAEDAGAPAAGADRRVGRWVGVGGARDRESGNRRGGSPGEDGDRP